MVRLFLIFLACFYVVPATAITAEELRSAAANNEREAAQRQNRANTGSLGSLLPGDSPVSTKYSTDADEQAEEEKTVVKRKTAVKSPEVVRTPAVSDSPNIYIPPARTSTGAGGQVIVSDAVHSTVAFGVRLGTWMDAALGRNTTSGDSGSVELTLSNDVVGDRHTLPAGTVLFADKTLNSSTKRMEMLVTHGITPSGQEFDMRGMVFDPQKTPGLAGVYILDSKEVAARGMQKGALAAVGAAVEAVGGGPVGAATNAATQSVLNDAKQVTEGNASGAIIYVSPQALIIRVEKQF